MDELRICRISLCLLLLRKGKRDSTGNRISLILLATYGIKPIFTASLYLHTMKNFWLLFLILSATLISSCTKRASGQLPIEAALEELDATLSRKATYEQEKERQLQSTRKLLEQAGSDENRYLILDRLYQEYYNYNNDSAFHYANIKRQLAVQKHLEQMQTDSRIDWAEVHLIAGMYKECNEILADIVPAETDTTERRKYYYLYRSLYRAMSSTAVEDSLRQSYTEKGLEYLRRRQQLLPSDGIEHLYAQVEEAQSRQQHNQALELLLHQFNKPNLPINEQAVLAFMIANSYERQKQLQKAIYYYTLSATNDVKTATHKHTSLHSLAWLLFDQGDIERAYAYINYAMSDALSVNSRVNIHYITRLLPLIQQSHDQMMKEKREQLHRLVWCVSVLAGCLLLTIFIVYQSKKKVSQAKRILDETNGELKEVNNRLTYSNTCLQESNNIKEAYIGYYMDLCSNYINKVEEYRNNLNNIVRTQGINEVMKVIRRPPMLKNELDGFYEDFDAAFLKIFPNFVKQFNTLLQSDKQIVLKPGELLNTELRIFALIRLGIGDSLKIAEFLRRSPSTIYNYRVKYRNAAINNRDDFDNQVRGL